MRQVEARTVYRNKRTPAAATRIYLAFSVSLARFGGNHANGVKGFGKDELLMVNLGRVGMTLRVCHC